METGLALAGGGVPGAAAVGVLMALEEAGITVTHITGTSSGAMVAALYAYGYAPQQLLGIVPMLNRRYLDFDWRGILYKALFRRPSLDGWLKGERLYKLMAELTHYRDLSALRIPCGIVATDLADGKPFVFANAEVPGYSWDYSFHIAEAVRASFAIPVLFRPFRRDAKLLVDGGVSTNCPVRICRAMGASKVIAVDSVTLPAAAPSLLDGSFSILYKVIQLTLKQQMENEHACADMGLLIDVGTVGAFDFHKVGDCIEAGYRTAAAHLDDIKAALGEG
ncbi:patatin-like phospholipase family protein [Paenibacillus chartarius]|uniref:Patatin-like phospholipase family protein n=1 Tax=Paenibacillus chartarius TaxID=747481 RepID=A0ABV6DQQ1_9BACL